MAEFSAATNNALSVIAHLAMAADISKNVKGMEGFRDFYQGTLPAADQAVIKRFDQLCKQAYTEFSRLMNESANDGH